MRKVLIVALILCAPYVLLLAQSDPILFEVEGDKVALSEFKYIYEKNNGDKADYSESSLEDYLDLYLKFKLKVQRAKEMGLDTLKVLQNELAGYRKQLANSYLVDKEVANKLIDEVAVRMKEDRKVRHIFIPAEPKSSEEKIKKAQEQISNIKRKLDMGSDFKEMASTESQDKVSAMKGGDLGYYVSPLPDGFYEFENAMYNLKLGETSNPVRSKMGFHILQLNDVRSSRGEIEVAHILLRKKLNGQLVDGVEDKASSVYSKLIGGSPFDEMAKSISEDKKTANSSGYLGFFGINQFEKSFEDAAFNLKKDGDITEPVETKIGWHIIKRISKRSNSDEKELKKRIKSKIAKSDRYDIAKEVMIKNIKEASNFSENRQLLRDFAKGLNENFYSYKWQIPQGTDKELMSFGDKKYNMSDFMNVIKKKTKERLRFKKTKPYLEAVLVLYDAYVAEAALAYEEANLENKYPDFKALMREYEEGILLFEATKIEVWDKAGKDSIGLETFHQNNKSDYQWKKRAKVAKYTVNSDDQKLVKKIYKQAQKDNWSTIIENYNKDGIVVIADEFTVEEGNDALTGLKLKKGASSSISFDKNTGASKFSVVESVIPASQKTMNEARGYIIADYQDHLEAEWISLLKSKYKSSINKDVLNSITK